MFWRMFLYWNLCNDLMIRLGPSFGGRLWQKDIFVTSYQGYNSCQASTVNPCFNPFHIVCFGRKSLHTGHSQEGWVDIWFLLRKYICMDYLDSSVREGSLFIHSFICLFTSVGTYGCLLHFRLYSDTAFRVYCSNCSSFGHWELFLFPHEAFWRNPVSDVFILFYGFRTFNLTDILES
jgi:hypothetical protein